MIKYLRLLFLAGAIAVISCEKYIEFEDEVKQPKIVLNALFDTDSVFQVHLSRSLSVVDNGILSEIQDGQVTVSDANGNLIETFTHVGNGFYHGNIKPQLNTAYEVKAAANGFTAVSANDAMPSQVIITSVDTLSYLSSQRDSLLSLSIKFQDNGSYKNYYKLQVNSVQQNGGFLYYSEMYIYSDDLSAGLQQDESVDELLFTDELFNGNEKTLKVAIFNTKSYDDYLEVNLYAISESYYLYAKSYQGYQNSQGNPFAQPVLIYGNITNGFGIFGNQNVTTKKVDF